jgi:hypothetical protein
MPEPPSKVLIQLALTARQQRQIRSATGREIRMLELRLVPLPPPAARLPDPEQPTGSPEPLDRIEPGRNV